MSWLKASASVTKHIPPALRNDVPLPGHERRQRDACTLNLLARWTRCVRAVYTGDRGPFLSSENPRERSAIRLPGFGIEVRDLAVEQEAEILVNQACRHHGVSELLSYHREP